MTMPEIADAIEGAIAVIESEMAERRTPRLAVVKVALERCLESIDAMDGTDASRA